MKTIVNKYEFTSPYIKEETTTISFSDLHWVPGGRNKEIITSLASKIETINPDFILCPGDLINSPSCLETQANRVAFVEDIKRITGGRLMIYSKGNHEGMILGPNGWIAVESTILQDTLLNLDNVIYLDNLDGFSLADPSLIGKGYTTANIYVAGGSLPASYYIDEKESLEAYCKHLLKMFENKQKPFVDGMQNILLLHDIRKLIIAVKKGMLPESVLELLREALDNGGHYHNAGFTNWFAYLLPIIRGLTAPSGEMLPEYVEGSNCIDGIYTLQNGYAGDFKPDSSLINGVYRTFDVPAVSEITFVPGEKTGLTRRRIYRR